jgi:hypothetical protein
VDVFVGGTFIGLLFLIWIAVLILPTIFFILTQQRALSKCSPANRTMSPGLAWLQIVPVLGFIWQFFVVSALANSLANEFRARGIQEEERPGYGVGLAMCITRICVIIPVLGFFSLVASLILWIVYWVKIAGFSAKLDVASAGPYSPPAYGGGYYGQAPTGGVPYLGAPGGAPASPSTSGPSSAGARPCATCGASVPAGQAFCNQCGAKV